MSEDENRPTQKKKESKHKRNDKVFSTVTRPLKEFGKKGKEGNKAIDSSMNKETKSDIDQLFHHDREFGTNTSMPYYNREL